MAEEPNKFFQSVFVDESDGKVIEAKVNYTHEEGSLNDIKFTAEKVHQAIMEIKPGKSGGPDGVRADVLRNCAKQLAVPLSMLFQKSLDNGALPQDWKMANIIPIYKRKGSKKDAGNYRPVSLTSQVVKTMERIVRKSLAEFARRKNIISKHQYGFQAGKSSGSQLLSVFEDWTKALEDQNAPSRRNILAHPKSF